MDAGSVGEELFLTEDRRELSESRTVLKVSKSRSDDAFLDSAMQARLCVRLRLRSFKGEPPVVENEMAENGFEQVAF